MHNPTQSGTVAEAYEALVARGAIEGDGQQRRLVARLDALLADERKEHLSRKSSSLGWLFSAKGRPAARRGLYIHGAVGRGKSMLMDLFFDLAPGEKKRRVHFNAFMADAHERIHRHRQEFAAGLAKEADPIPVVARALASEAKLLCFDEFSVTDIADAMVLGRLFSAMFAERVRIVATSNVPPDGLYRDGLNRQLFLPFVDLLKRNMEVFELDARTDFRLEKIRRGQAYLSPLNDRNAAAMATIWAEMTAGRQAGPVTIRLKGRELVVPKAVGRSAWFSFAELCGEPRGAIDYLAIAERFDTLFIEGVPMMDLSRRNEAKRFILLIDTLYDNGIHAVISAAANPHALYQATSGVEVFEFRRTASRLIEMQSGDYEARSARPRLAGTSH